MSEDILERAKALLVDLNAPYEIKEDGPGHWIMDAKYKDLVIELMPELIAEVERLRRLMDVVENTSRLRSNRLEEQIEALVIQKNAKDTRIKEREAENERLKAAFIKAETERKFYTTINGMSSEFDWNEYPEVPMYGIHKEWFRQQAREALERIKAETGSGDHVAGANKLILTAEQREEIRRLIEPIKNAGDVIRAMLEEGKRDA